MIQNVRGTKDLFGDEIKNFDNIINISQKIGQNFGFLPLQTPIFEFSDVFERNLGDDSDIISKEVYKFPDRGDNFLTLRPEFTAAIIRSFLNHSELNQQLPQKLFSFGPIFRYDRPQKGRQRQFHQINFELIGAADLNYDVELILLASKILQNLQIKDFTLQINSLGCAETKNKYEIELKNYFSKYKNDLSKDSQDRLLKNPLRILDSKDKNDNKIASQAPKISNFYSSEAKNRFENILSNLDNFNIKYEVNERLVRGLDYYTSTVFEFTTNDLGAQNTILAGGRYDDLIAKMGSKNQVAAAGFAAGIERLMLLSEFETKKARPICLIYYSKAESLYCTKLAEKLRAENLYVDILYGANFKKQMKKASQLDAKYIIVIGGDEIKNNLFKVKDFDIGNEIILKDSEIINFFKNVSF